MSRLSFARHALTGGALAALALYSLPCTLGFIIRYAPAVPA